ncbi:COG3400 family protein [Nitratiruptor sp. YY09-18]|uniref:COG3400 family protein n=1 Tax=Nitratiruptor sp. YY09-18 TaxID=2724901 RepID=UPI00191550A7|nr:TrkA C-terminal domain-containing protein [Nitratiruptor sp. YY09-18]BCD68284.1 hypothetical protein NitYY0918_C1195 [Nitratiruptor sp. YY09-18]
MQTEVLILADGIVAKHLLQRLVKNYITKNRYHIVYQDPRIKPKTYNENFLFYQFDPTSYIKLSKLFAKRFKEVVIVLGNRVETLASFENVRRLDRSVNIVVLDKWDLDIEDKNFIQLNANEILANRVIDHLPNVPVIAQNVGLGLGEIMEVLVPFGSAYVYRHVGSIEQKNWKIAAIYRNNKLILPTSSTMIWPNDLLLLIGDPQVLKEVFRSIKQEVGQFPMPFGVDAYLFIDMGSLDVTSMRHLVLAAVHLHSKLKDKKLFVRVANPNNIEFLNFLKSYESADIDIEIDYRYQNGVNLIETDMQKLKTGLFITHNRCFMQKELRKKLYNYRIPVFSVANTPISNIEDAGLILTQNRSLEYISSIVFDIAIQLELALKIYEYDQVNSELVDHFQNLANIYSKPIKFVKTNTNPIRYLKAKEKNILLVFPFSKKVVQAAKWNIFSTDPESLFFKLNRFHQMFIPES